MDKRLQSPKDAKEKINSWANFSNTKYPHLSIDMKTPQEMKGESELVEELEQVVNSNSGAKQEMGAKSG